MRYEIIEKGDDGKVLVSEVWAGVWRACNEGQENLPPFFLPKETGSNGGFVKSEVINQIMEAV